MFIKLLFDEKENKLDYCRERDCIENSCKKLKKHAMKIINYEKKEMIPLTKEENKSYKEQETYHICQEKFCKDDENYKNKRKVNDHCHYTGKFRGAAHNKCSLNYKIPKDIPIIIHNASYDIHFIINQLAEEFKGELNCIGENMEKYITFSVPIKKECDDSKIITYKLRFIVSFRFMSASLSELVDNLSGKIFNSIVCTKCMQREKINLECKFDGLKDNRLSYKCRQCREIWYDLINGLIKKFPSIYQFCNGDLNKFILLLRKGVYRYQYMDSWEKFDETTLPPKEVFHSSNLNLHMETRQNCAIQILIAFLLTLKPKIF